MGKPQTISFKRRHLPHWKVVGRSYFITFRLYNSLPQSVVKKLKDEREKLLKNNPKDEEVIKLQRKEFMKIETILDCASGSNCHLRIPEIADEVMKTFDFIEENYKWRIPYIVVMPNHVHCLMAGQDKATRNLEKSLGALKRHTAIEANRIMGREGRFWVDENFDHWCRSPEKELSVREYIRNNPVKAGLVKDWRQWKWLKIRE